KRLNGSFAPVIVDLQTTILHKRCKLFPLFLAIVDGLPQGAFWQGIDRLLIKPRRKSIQHRLTAFESTLIAFPRRYLFEVTFNLKKLVTEAKPFFGCDIGILLRCGKPL